VVVMMVGLEFPQVIREGRIEEWALSQSKSAELLLLAWCLGAWLAGTVHCHLDRLVVRRDLRG
jgi:hypothetical protein